MIYQEINLPVWAQLLIMGILLIVLVLLATIKSVDEPEVIEVEIPDNHVGERYGAYIQSQGRYYN